MTESRKPRELWIFNKDFEIAHGRCDLGDWSEATISLYPHKEDSQRMFKVREVLPNEPNYRELCKELFEALTHSYMRHDAQCAMVMDTLERYRNARKGIEE